MDIDPELTQPETCTCYNCGEPGHLFAYLHETSEAEIRQPFRQKTDLKSAVDEAVVAAMDARELPIRPNRPKSWRRCRWIFSRSW